MPADDKGVIRRRRRAPIAPALLLVVGVTAQAPAQELEPRAYSPSPVGANILVVGYGRSSGEVLFEPSVPITDVDAEFNAVSIAYQHTFEMFGRAANALVVAPYVWGDVSGKVGEESNAITRSGLGDPRLRLGINLVGGPALTLKEFVHRKPTTTLGASLTVVPPLGQYDSTKLINLGANRWAFKPELGVSYPIGRWFLEGYAGVWLFTDNDEFFGGARREQDPIGALQLHASYAFRPRLWLAFDSTWYAGGQSTVDGVHNDDRQSNTRVGLTLSLPLGARQSVKFTWSEGATTRIGGNFTTIGVAWQHTWLPR